MCKMISWKWLIPAIAACALASSHAAAANEDVDVVIFDQPVSKNDRRRDYANAVLHAVMERTVPDFGPYHITHAPVHMERPRLLAALKEGKLVNLTAYPAASDWMRALRPVQIPIDMGLQSWRILLIDAKNQPSLRAVGSLAQLARLQAGAGSAWATLESLRSARLPVTTGGSYEGLFQMLMAGRFDYFPRGVNEIFAEYDTHHPANPTLAIEDSLLLHDQIPSLFFVAPRAVRLHLRISTGMEAMLKDGSLERLVLAHYKDDLRRAKLCGRKRFELPNRQLESSMFTRRELWFNPFETRHGLCPALLPR